MTGSKSEYSLTTYQVSPLRPVSALQSTVWKYDATGSHLHVAILPSMIVCYLYRGEKISVPLTQTDSLIYLGLIQCLFKVGMWRREYWEGKAECERWTGLQSGIASDRAHTEAERDNLPVSEIKGEKPKALSRCECVTSCMIDFFFVHLCGQLRGINDIHDLHI